jgi:hypothetical protein
VLLGVEGRGGGRVVVWRVGIGVGIGIGIGVGVGVGTRIGTRSGTRIIGTRIGTLSLVGSECDWVERSEEEAIEKIRVLI